MDKDDDILDDKLRQAQRELAAIKNQYATLPTTTTVRIPIQQQPTSIPVAPKSNSQTVPPSNQPHPAQKQLEIAEGVMLKLYKKNLALEHQIRQLNIELTQAKTTAATSTPRKNTSTELNHSKLQLEISQPNQEQHQTQNHIQIQHQTTPSLTVQDTPDITELQQELITQRSSCARFAAQNRALRSDFTRLAQQKIQPLLNSSSVGHATQEVLALLAATLNRFEIERTSEINDYAERLNASEEAHIEVLAKLKMLERTK